MSGEVYSDLMNEYMKETGKPIQNGYDGTILSGYVWWLEEKIESQLMWRDATKENPEINKEVLFKINKDATPLVWRFDGEWWWTDNGNYTKAKDGNRWLPIPKE